MKCSNCNEELSRLQIRTQQDEVKEIYSHPPTNPFKPCPYQTDGLRVTVEVIDQFMCDKFQELVNSMPQGASGQKASPLILPEVARATNLDKIKDRVADGKISVVEFDEIKKRLDLNE